MVAQTRSSLDIWNWENVKGWSYQDKKKNWGDMES